MLRGRGRRLPRCQPRGTRAGWGDSCRHSSEGTCPPRCSKPPAATSPRPLCPRARPRRRPGSWRGRKEEGHGAARPAAWPPAWAAPRLGRRWLLCVPLCGLALCPSLPESSEGSSRSPYMEPSSPGVSVATTWGIGTWPRSEDTCPQRPWARGAGHALIWWLPPAGARAVGVSGPGRSHDGLEAPGCPGQGPPVGWL